MRRSLVFQLNMESEALSIAQPIVSLMNLLQIDSGIQLELRSAHID